MAEAVVGAMVSTGTSMMMQSACAEKPDWTALENQNTESIGMLEDQLKNLVGPGGQFEKKGDVIEKGRNIATTTQLHEGSVNVKNTIRENKNLVNNLGFASSGTLDASLNDKLTDINNSVNDKFSQINFATEKQWNDLEEQRFQTVGAMEREMNSILAQYAGTTGDAYSGTSIDFTGAYDYNLRT